jgi:ATP adenylyltransferase
VPAFSKKPWPGHEVKDGPSRPDPFGNPELAMVLMELPDYLVQLNKFCILRPQLLLHPRAYAAQADRLTEADLAASLRVMGEFSPDALAFYNCGPASGSSQPYKHVQIVLKPGPEEFVVWPELAFQRKIRTLDDGPPVQLSVPYLARYGLVQRDEEGQIFRLYQDLLASLEIAIGEPVRAHNVVFTRDWLCVVPRRSSGGYENSGPPANSMGMMGVVWVQDEEERRWWDRAGYEANLQELGYPPD